MSVNQCGAEQAKPEMPVSPKARSPEVSIVLNLHNEARFLRRTMMSIEEAVRFAGPYGISCEILCVLDRADPNTRAWIDAYDFSLFTDCAVIESNNGSLGLSRNDGIARANGEYIWLCDADDLISYNLLAGLYQTSVTAGRKTIIIPEFLLAFGATFHIARYFGTDRASKLLLFQMHPLISRIFAHRALFESLQFGDARLSRGFAYEDWHFNCEALARGYEFHVARQTMFFYRRRPDSLGSAA
jgi:glycosyltransferase involved in cell wall biosynthesis